MADVQIRRSDFGNDFVFGSATSAYQIEGAAIDGGKGLSIWDTFTLNTPNKIEDGSNANVTAHQYAKFREDVKLMKKTGLDAYRFSISWSRILPGGKLCTGVNREGIKFYNELIDAILAEGMQPYATIFHWDLPLALELEYGGFLSNRIVDDFRDFAELCFWEFGDRVKHWITINEAWTYTFKGYVNGTFPPGRGAADTPIVVEKQVMTSLANSRDLFELLDVGGSWQDQFKLLPSRQEIREYMKNILPSLVDTISLADIDKLVKDYFPLVAKELPFVEQLINYIKDVIIGLYLDYKNSKRAEACQNGDPGREPYIVAHNIILAHANAVDIYRKKFQAHQCGKIGMTNNANFYLPYNPNNDQDVKAAGRALDFMFYWFVSPLVTGDYPQSMRERVKERLPVFTEEEVKLVKGSYDFLGVNYYTTYYAIDVVYDPTVPPPKPNYTTDQDLVSTPFRGNVPIGPKAGSDWLYIYPPGIYGLLVDIKTNYQNPLLYITENGVDEKTNNKQTVCEARDDQTRIDYHRDHLLYMKKAIDEGVNVTAYFIWSFADNFEWAEGYCVRFGIFYVDFMNGRLSRNPKESAIWWMNFLSKNIVTTSAKRIRDMEVDTADPVKRTRLPKNKISYT